MSPSRIYVPDFCECTVVRPAASALQGEEEGRRVLCDPTPRSSYSCVVDDEESPTETLSLLDLPQLLAIDRGDLHLIVVAMDGDQSRLAVLVSPTQTLGRVFRRGP